MAAALQAQGKLDQALQAYDRSIQLKPDDAKTYHNRGLTLKALGRLQEAVQSYEKAIQLQPDFAQAYYNLGIALQQLEQLALAAASFTMAIRLKPDFAEAYINRGNAEINLGELEHGVELESREPHDPEPANRCRQTQGEPLQDGTVRRNRQTTRPSHSRRRS